MSVSKDTCTLPARLTASCATRFFAFAILACAATPAHLFSAPPLPPITALAFSPDGKQVVRGSQAGLEVFSWPDLTRVKTLPSKLAHINDLSFSPDGKTLGAVGGSPSEKGEVEWFTWPEGESRGRIAGHDDVVYRLAWQPMSPSKERPELFATAAADRLVLVRGFEERKPISLAGHSRSVLAVVFLRDGQTLVSAGVDQSLRVWNISDGKLLRTLDNHTAAVNDLAVRPGQVEGPPMVASGGADRTVRLWQPTVGRLVRFARLPSVPLALAWTGDGGRLVAACVDGRVRVLDPDSMQVEFDVPALEGWAYSLAISPDDKWAVVGGPSGKLKAVPLVAPGN